MTRLLVLLLRGYRYAISPLYGQVCRFHPTCSAYALEAVTEHGSLRGSWLAVRRVARCHPWAAGGVDPVPARRNQQDRLSHELHDDPHDDPHEPRLTRTRTQGA